MLDASLKLIGDKGLAGLRLNEVGRLAGYSRGLAAMRYGTRVGLLTTLSHHLLDGWLARLGPAVAGKSGLDAVLAAIHAQCVWMTERPTDVRALYLIIFASFDPGADFHFAIQRTLDAQRRDMTRWLREAAHNGQIQTGVDADCEAEQILATMAGIIYQSLIDPRLDVARMHRRLMTDVEARLNVRSAVDEPPAPTRARARRTASARD